MAIRKYTIPQLKALRDSPLVQKPEKLPAIEQWIEYVYLEMNGVRQKLRIPHSEAQGQTQKESSTARQRQQRPGMGGAAGSDGSPMGSFSTG